MITDHPSLVFTQPDSEAFLASEFVSQTSCLILDVAMPGMSGPDLQRELASRRQMIPIVFITASGDRAIRDRLPVLKSSGSSSKQATT